MKKIIFCLTACLLLTACTSDNNIKSIMKAAKVNQSTAEQIFSVLQSVGVQNINRMSCNIYSDRKACTAQNYDLLFENIYVYLSQDGTVELITAGKTLYENNKVIANIYDNMTSKDDFLYLIDNSKQKTLKVLKSPASAVFPAWQEWKFEITKDSVSLLSFVDSQNSYGAMVRTPIQFEYGRKQKYNGFEYFFKSAAIGNIKIK